MTPIAIWLLALGVTDLVASPGGTPPAPLRASVAAAVGAATIALAILGSAMGLGAWPCAIVVLAGAVLLGAWTNCRQCASSPRRAGMLLAALGVATLAIAGTAGLWPESDGGAIRRWLEQLPYAVIEGSPEQAAAAAAVMVMLLATGNAIVRLALRSVEVDLGDEKSPESKLRGGRLIGPIERLLVFTLAIGGQPTAAALIISAKGLLRFPELNASRKNGDAAGVDLLTEYLLVGSLVSWSVALAPIAFLP